MIFSGVCLAITKNGSFWGRATSPINGAGGFEHQVVKGAVKSWKRFRGLNSQGRLQL